MSPAALSCLQIWIGRPTKNWWSKSWFLAALLLSGIVCCNLNLEQKVIVLCQVAASMHEMLPAMRTLKGQASSLVSRQSQNNHLVVLLLSTSASASPSNRVGCFTALVTLFRPFSFYTNIKTMYPLNNIPQLKWSWCTYLLVLEPSSANKCRTSYLNH